MKDKNKLALALSGGGVRAMVFHAGVLRYLAENECLEKVEQISTVSGGSLLAGLIFKQANYQWPTSDDYINKVYPAIRELLCTKSLQVESVFELLKPSNWKNIFSRANVLSKTIEKKWKIDKRLNEIAGHPIWSIEATTAETGKRFRFGHDMCGDYSIGYSVSKDFKIANAMSASAAFPGGIGPLKIHIKNHNWLSEPNTSSGKNITPPYKKLHLYDGGLYDNLASEKLFDPGHSDVKCSEYSIFVSDASSPLSKKFSIGTLNPLRLLRVIDIIMDQARLLRVRSLMNYFKQEQGQGGYIMIGSNPSELLDAADSTTGKWQSKSEVEKAASYPTNLSKISKSNFDLISRHGWELAKAIDCQKGITRDLLEDNKAQLKIT